MKVLLNITLYSVLASIAVSCGHKANVDNRTDIVGSDAEAASENVERRVEADVVTKDFVSSQLVDGLVTFDVNHDQVSTEFELLRKKEVINASDLFQQKEFPAVAQTFQQAGTGVDINLAKVPVANSIVIVVDGTQLNANDFTVAGQKVTLNTAPSDGVTVSINYKEKIALTKEFMISPDTVANSIVVKVNNIEDKTVTYKDGKITFANAPAEGALVDVTYKILKLGDAISRFPLVTEWGGVRDLKAIDKETKEEISISYIDEQVVIDPKAFADGRKIIVSYRDESSDEKSFSLPDNPLLKTVSLSLLGDAGSFVCEGSDFTVLDQQLISNCETSDATKMSVSYKYEKDKKKEFVVEGVADASQYDWAVWVNDKRVANYQLSGNKVVFENFLSPSARVKVRASRKK